MFGLLHNHRLIFRSRTDVGGGVSAFAFSPKRGSLGALPGQHGIVAVTTSLRKPFSLASAPEEDQVLIATSLTSGSPFKKRFGALAEGDEIQLRGPIYTYTKPFMIDPDAAGSVLLAQGVGITPFRSMLSHLDLTGRSATTSLIHVAAHGHAFRDETERWSTDSRYVTHSDEFRSAVVEAVDADPARDFYVAGAPSFTAATVGLLRGRGVAPRRIHDDPYLFYKPPAVPDIAAR